jgi:Colicin V production protein
MLYLCILIFFVFFAGIAMTIGEGLWNNTINLLAVIVSGVAAVSLGYPLGLLVLEKLEKPAELAWYFVFAGVWIVFFVWIMVFRVIGERLSRVRMKFVPPLEVAAGPVMGLFLAVMFTSFLAFTLYFIPIRAGYWDASKASSWQQSTMRSGAGPFYTVLKSVGGDEIANASVGR